MATLYSNEKKKFKWQVLNIFPHEKNFRGSFMNKKYYRMGWSQICHIGCLVCLVNWWIPLTQSNLRFFIKKVNVSPLQFGKFDFLVYIWYKIILKLTWSYILPFRILKFCKIKVLEKYNYIKWRYLAPSGFLHYFTPEIN